MDKGRGNIEEELRGELRQLKAAYLEQVSHINSNSNISHSVNSFLQIIDHWIYSRLSFCLNIVFGTNFFIFFSQ